MKRIEGQPKGGTAEYQRWYRKNNPEVGSKAQRKWRLKTLYDMTPEEYEHMSEQQGHVCAICEQPQTNKALAVDHNHTTGEVRGLLCENCNRALGKFKDDARLIEKALDYIEEHTDG